MKQKIRSKEYLENEKKNLINRNIMKVDTFKYDIRNVPPYDHIPEVATDYLSSSVFIFIECNSVLQHNNFLSSSVLI